MITIFKRLREVKTPFFRSVEFALDRIKSGNSKQQIELIRKEKNKDKRDALKEELPSICFSGEFSNRSEEGLKKHSGFVVFDFDDYEDQKKLSKHKKELQSDPYTYSVFISPSGDGLKLLVKIPAEAENHLAYFNALKEYYNHDHHDESGSDVSRVCYESYDPDIYINPKSKVWTKKEEEPGYTYTERVPIIPLSNEQEIIDRLMVWFNKKYSISEGQRNSSLFKLASAFNDYGIHEAIARSKFYIYESKDFTSKEIDKIVKSAYSKKAQFGSKYFENINVTKQILVESKSGKSPSDIHKIFKEVPKEKIEQLLDSTPFNLFWNKSDKGKITIDNFKYKEWLQGNGFYKYYPEGSDGFIFIRIENNLIDNTTEVKLKDFVLNHLLSEKEFLVYQYMTNQARFFKEDMLNTLDPISVKFKNDTKDTSYLYFINCAVEVTDKEIKTIDYINLDGFVWKKHVINFDYVSSTTSCDYKKFVRNISGKDEVREQSIRSTIGYLLSSFKNASNNVAVIINDETISENPNGGTGKGIFLNAISKLKRCAIIDGKSFDFKKSFPYQIVSADTQTLAFDDVPKNFPFENLFSIVTEGITLEKKNKDAIKIPIDRSPKIVITTNYALPGDGNSFERRKWEIEFSQHYHKNHTPLDDFDKLLFEEWDNKEWNRFYSYMIECLQLFLKKGLIQSQFKNLKVRKFISATNHDFFEWITDGKIEHNERINKGDKHQQFISDYPDHKKWLSRKKFAKWIDNYCAYIGAEMLEGNTLGARWIEIKTDKINSNQAPF